MIILRSALLKNSAIMEQFINKSRGVIVHFTMNISAFLKFTRNNFTVRTIYDQFGAPVQLMHNLEPLTKNGTLQITTFNLRHYLITVYKHLVPNKTHFFNKSRVSLIPQKNLKNSKYREVQICIVFRNFTFLNKSESRQLLLQAQLWVQVYPITFIFFISYFIRNSFC